MPQLYRDVAEDVAFTVLDGMPMWFLVGMTAMSWGVFVLAAFGSIIQQMARQ
jgi:hypothetical protein